MSGDGGIAGELLAHGREADPALLHRGRTVTFGELREGVRRRAAFLSVTGLAPGDRVLLHSDNSPYFVFWYLATLRAGLVVVPVPTASDAPRLARIASLSGARLLLASPRFEDEARAAAALQPGLGVVSEDEPAPAPAGDPPPIAPDALAALMFTSGSTGEPKGVTLTHRNLARNTADIAAYLELSSADRALLVLPLHYCYGASVLHTHLLAGASVVLVSSFMFPEKVLDEMRDTECTGFAGVPSTYQVLLRRTRFRERTFPSLRWLQQAGGRLPDAQIREVRAALPGVRFFVMYGQTEATARLSFLPPERLDEKIGSIGKGLPSVRLEVLREDGLPVRPGSDEVGEIVASGESISAGYWHDPAETARTFREGRLRTGDVARVDADGFLYLVDRARDFVKVAGSRVSPRTIEEALAEHPAIVESAVVGAPDALLGEALVAYVVPVPGSALTEATIEDHCRSRLPNHEVPSRIVLLDALPKNESGKVLRQALRERAGAVAT